MATPGPLGLGTPVGSGSFAARHGSPILATRFSLTGCPARLKNKRKLRAAAKKKTAPSNPKPFARARRRCADRPALDPQNGPNPTEVHTWRVRIV